MDKETEKKDRSEYMRAYYLENKEKIVERKRNKCLNDPGYKEELKRRRSEYARRKRQERNQMIKDGIIEKPQRKSWYVVVIKKVEFKAYTKKVLAKRIGRSSVGVTMWINDGFIPKTPLRIGPRIRVYTDDMIDVVKKVFKKYGRMTVDQKHKIYAEIFTG